MSAEINPATGQMVLDIEPLITPEVVTGATIQERFEEFHRLNPWVLESLEKLTQDYLERGHKRVGVKMMFEVLRWEYGRATRGDTFKLNNDYTSRYVRKMIARRPEWQEVFSTRQLQTA